MMTFSIGTAAYLRYPFPSPDRRSLQDNADSAFVPVDSSLCAQDVPESVMPCNGCNSTFCDTTRCSGHGVCDPLANVCDCEDGYNGTVCELSPTCSGPVDAKGKCCGIGGK